MHDVHPETEVRRLLGAAAETIPTAGTDLLGGVRRRQAQQRMRARAAVAVGSAAAVAAGALFAVTGTGAPSALAAVTSAAARTGGQSYRVTVVSNESLTAEHAGRRFLEMRMTGEFDPVRNAGEETVRVIQPSLSGRTQFRFLHGYVYWMYADWMSPSGKPLSAGKPWAKARAATLPASAPELARFVFWPLGREPVNPQEMLALLKSATTVRDEGPASGPGWTGTKYSFSVTIKNGPYASISGTVYVDQQGRVRQLEATRVMRAQIAAQVGIRSITNDMTFGDFGVRVSVSAPPASQVYTVPGSVVISW